MQTKYPQYLYDEKSKMVEILQQLNLAVEGVVLSDYKECQELSLSLREEGRLTSQYYCQTISKLAIDLACIAQEI